MKKILIAAVLFSQLALAWEYSPSLNPPIKTNLYWGDLHVHSNASPDAFAFGNEKLPANDALRFAKGERITASNGMDLQLRRSLDFLLVADHAEFIGIFPRLRSGDPEFLATDLGVKWRKLLDDSGSISVIIQQWLMRIQDPHY